MKTDTIKGFVQQEEIMIIKVYTPNSRTASYVKQLLTGLRRATNPNSILVWDLHTPLTSMDKSTSRNSGRKQQVPPRQENKWN